MTTPRRDFEPESLSDHDLKAATGGLAPLAAGLICGILPSKMIFDDAADLSNSTEKIDAELNDTIDELNKVRDDYHHMYEKLRIRSDQMQLIKAHLESGEI